MSFVDLIGSNGKTQILSVIPNVVTPMGVGFTFCPEFEEEGCVHHPSTSYTTEKNKFEKNKSIFII